MLTHEQIAALRELEKKATPAGWWWAHDHFNDRSKRLAKARGYRHRPRDNWFALLVGPFRGERVQNPPPDHLDPFDCPWIYGLRWSSIKGSTVLNGMPHGADAELIVSMRNALPDLLRLAEIGLECEHKAQERGA